MRPPNVLLVLCHDLGRRLGCYGVAKLSTPALDALAGEGVLCENYFATAPLCSPSRGSIMTGLYPHSNGLMGLVNRGWDMPDGHATLAQLLRAGCGRAAAYECVLFGFQHEKQQAERMGYERHYHAQRPYWCDTVSAQFAAWVRGRRRGARPFFACLGFSEVHRDFKGPRYTPADPATVDVPAYLPDTPQVREDLADLGGLIVAVDATMERVLAGLEQAGCADNTLVVFSTDHGIAFPRAKSTLYDPGVETALILRWRDGFDGGRRCKPLLSNVDLLPTVLDCAAVPVPEPAQGRSFLPMLRGQGYEARQEIFAEKTWHDVYDPMRAVRTERFKYVRNFPGQDGSPAAHRPQLCLPTDIERSLSRRSLAGLGDPHLRPRGEEELYDLSKDPDELRNVAEEPAYGRLLSELRRRLEEWMATTGDPLLAGPVSCPDPVLQNR